MRDKNKFHWYIFTFTLQGRSPLGDTTTRQVMSSYGFSSTDIKQKEFQAMLDQFIAKYVVENIVVVNSMYMGYMTEPEFLGE